MNIIQKDKKYISRGGEQPKEIVITRTEGSYVYDDRGRKYIDFLMGWCVGNIGWGNAEVRRAIRQFRGPDYVTPSYMYRPWTELAELLARITPGRLQKTFFATGGTEAVETALQAAMSHTGRHHFISIQGSYHGHSIGAMSVGDSAFRKQYHNLLFHCNKIKPPLDTQAADKIITLLKLRKVAALIMEPIIINLGVEIPTKEFFNTVSAACKKYNTLLIADEVATGFGRTGKLFSSEHYGLRPDIMTLGKGLTGGYGALGATIVTPEIAKSMEWGFSHYSTFGWTPINVAATLANVRHFLKHQKHILTHAAQIAEYLHGRLRDMPFRYPFEIHQAGLAIAIHFDGTNYPGQIITRSRRAGLLMAKEGRKALIMFPALNVPMTVAKRAMDILESIV